MPARATDNTRTEVWTDRGLLERNAAAVDALCDDLDTPVTSRRTWWGAWLDAFDGFTPWVVARRDGAGNLLALAPLARRRRPGFTELTAIGDGASDYLSLPARTEQDAAALAAAIAEHLSTLRAPWTLALRQLAPGDPLVTHLARRLRFARLLEGRPAPRTAITQRESSHYLSRNYRKAARNRYSRLERGGHEPRVEFLHRPDEVRGWLDPIVDVARRREHEMVGRSHLDDPRRERFLRTVIVELAERGTLELCLLLADSEVAAYNLSLLDGGTYRMWNGHHDPRWADFSPGHVLDHHTIERILDDERFVEIDWMMGTEAYKYRAATRTVEAEELLAASSRSLAAVAFAPRLLRDALETVGERDERALQVLERLRDIRERVLRTGGSTPS